jgi:hypothetical protein
MKKAELAKKTVVSAGLDRLLSSVNGRHIGAMCIPDTQGMSIKNDTGTHVFGDGYTAIVLTVRNDGSPESIAEAISLMIASLATAQ